MEKFDIAIIGGGPAGYVAAIRAAQLGAATALVEKENIGGTCLNKGCIPTKALLQGAGFLDQIERGRKFGLVVGEVALDYRKLQARKDEVVGSLVDEVKTLLVDNGVQIFEGAGRLISPTRIQVSGSAPCEIETTKLILATGSVPSRPGIPGIDSPRVLTSDEALALRELPGSLVIVGGGAIGVEMATIFGKLGVQVSIVEMMPQILPGEDAEVAAALARSLGRMGIEILVGAKVSEIRANGGSAQVEVETPEAKRSLDADYVLLAVGRKPTLEGLRITEMGIELKSGAVAVNKQMETSVPGIYAVGDVVGGIMLAHVASREGMVAVENALGQHASMDYRSIPRCIYTIPEVAAVGISEQQANAEGNNVAVGRFGFLGNGRAKIGGETEGFVKVVVEQDYGEVLGVHIVGAHATELIGQATLAIKAELSTDVMRANVLPHPTLSEAIAEAFDDVFGQAIHVPKWLS